MLRRGPSVLLIVVWAYLSSPAAPAHGQRFPPFPPFAPFPPPIAPRPPTASELEFQRVGNSLAAPLNKQPVAHTGDYSDAIYAANLALELNRLEDDKKGVYIDFISAAYINPQIPRALPPDLQRLSRGAPSPPGFPAVAVSTSSASFGPRAPAGFPRPGVGAHRFPFARGAGRR